MAEKSLFVTGGSRGIGEAVVRRFSEEGWNVAFTYAKSQSRAETLKTELGERVLPLRLEMESDSAEMARIYKEAKTYFGIKNFDCYVGNAGITKSRTLDEMSESDISTLLRVNLESQILMTKILSRDMISERSGSIVLMSSMWGLLGASCESVYSASKSGLIGFGKSMALELSLSNVRVNMIAPGVIDTDMNAGYSEEEIEELIDATPLGRLGSPRDVANAVYFLASDEASFITGQVLGVDGGFAL